MTSAGQIRKRLNILSRRFHKTHDTNPLLAQVDAHVAAIEELYREITGPKQRVVMQPKPPGIAGMTKNELWAFAWQRFGIRMDIRLSVEQMRAELLERVDAEERPLERQLEAQLRDRFGWTPPEGEALTIDFLLAEEHRLEQEGQQEPEGSPPAGTAPAATSLETANSSAELFEQIDRRNDAKEEAEAQKPAEPAAPDSAKPKTRKPAADGLMGMSPAQARAAAKEAKNRVKKGQVQTGKGKDIAAPPAEPLDAEDK